MECWFRVNQDVGSILKRHKTCAYTPVITSFIGMVDQDFNVFLEGSLGYMRLCR